MPKKSDEPKKPSIFKLIQNASSAVLEAGIFKAKSNILEAQRKAEEDEENLLYSKALLEDPSYAIHAMGWKEKPYRLQNGHLKQMSQKSSIIAAIIQTRQNQVSNYSALSNAPSDKGWQIVIKNEKKLLEALKEELKGETKREGEPTPNTADRSAGPQEDKNDAIASFNWELHRRAKVELNKQFVEGKAMVEQYIENCGLLEQRPFDTKKWKFDGCLRAWVRDTLTYDLFASEMVCTKAGDQHHFFPVDASTIKFASPTLKQHAQNQIAQVELDILYPEAEARSRQKEKIIELDKTKLDEDEYKYVQVVRGRIERAFTDEELKIGIRNPTTNLYQNGYGISELELCVSLVTGHLNSEYYNQSYFTQGFSAKGILHIKSSISRRKLETVRQQWQHMIKGSRNSFQTPIFAGVDDVTWIPLTQSHNDIGFEQWLKYLTKMICSIYQIDPQELGIGYKEDGSGQSGGMSGDNTQEKLDASRERGLFPLLRKIEAYVNENIISKIDARFCFKFTGTTNESEGQRLDHLKKLGEFAYTVNEVREELGKPPLPEADCLILSAEYVTWFNAVFLVQPEGGENGGDVTDENESGKTSSKPKEPSEEVKKSMAVKFFHEIE